MLKYRIHNVVGIKKKTWQSTHKKKLENLKAKLSEINNLTEKNNFTKNVVHNLSSYTLSKEETEALSYGIDHYIPVKADRKRVEVEFEYFYNMFAEVIEMQEHEKFGLKLNLLNACKHTDIKVPYQYQNVVKTLSENQSICLLKQDKGRGVIIMNRTDYVEKCEQLIKSRQFV